MHYLTLSVGLSISVINEVCVVSRSAAWPLKLALFPLSWAGLYVMHTGCASFFCWLTRWQQKSRFLLNLPVFCHKHRCTSISRLKNPNPNFGYPKCSFVIAHHEEICGKLWQNWIGSRWSVNQTGCRVKLGVNWWTTPAQLSGHMYTLSLPGNSVLPFIENTPQAGKFLKSLSCKCMLILKPKASPRYILRYFILFHMA